MPLSTLNEFTTKVADLPDKPNTQMSASELKAQFDAAPEELRSEHNRIVNVLKSSTTGDSGAENIGSANISGVIGNTLHAQLKSVFEQMQQVVLGQIPNKSITREKFADGAVDFSPVQKEIANLNLQLDASQLVPSGKTYGWNPTTSFGVVVDFTKGKTTAQLNAGDTSLDGKVTMSQGTFVAGKKVTVLGRSVADNSVVKEEATITSVSPLTISPLVNSYKSGAWIKRTTASNTSRGFEFGGLDESITNTISDSTVTANAYDTSGNNARKLVRLSNGWFVAVAVDGTNTRIFVYKPEASNPQWTQLCFISQAVKPTIVSYNNRVIVVYKYSTSMKAVNIDVATVSNVDITSTAYTFTLATSSDRNDDSISAVIGNNEIHVAFTRVFNSHANTVNTGYVKGTINSDDTVTWGTVEQVTSDNFSASYPYFAINPSIGVYNGIPFIIIEQASDRTFALNGLGNGKQITILKRDATLLTSGYSGYLSTSWSAKAVYNVQTYGQSSPSAIFVPQSVNGLTNGRIWVAWHGTDASESVNNIRISYSDDGGATWSTMQKLTTGNSYGQTMSTLTANSNNEIFVLWQGTSTSSALTDLRIKQIKNTNGIWGSVIEKKSQQSESPSTLFDLSVIFSEPLFIYKGTTATKVGFYGTWTIGSVAPITENTLRFTITQQASEVMTYLHHSVGLTTTAKINGDVMDKVTASGESQFTKVLGSLQDIEIEITMTRATVNDDVYIDKILGGVA